MAASRDRRIVLWILGAMVAVIIVFSMFAPANDDSDSSPTTYNSGSEGIKAAYLVLGRLGYAAERWESAPEELKNVDAAKTTLILADPNLPTENAKDVQAKIADFLSRGGRVLATGREGAYFFPMRRQMRRQGCISHFALRLRRGRAGWHARVRCLSGDYARWTALEPRFRVSQLCGEDAVVVSYKHGAGEAIWWSSDRPLTNRGLKEDASLKLVLASMGGADRRVFFDEYFHGTRASLWDTTKGLPLRQIAWQCAVVAVLLVLSFGRRSGPIRLPVAAAKFAG